MLFGYIGADDAIQDGIGKPFHHALVFVGLAHGVLFVHPCSGQKESQKKGADEEDSESVFGERNVERSREITVSFQFHQFPGVFVGTDGGDVEVGTFMAIGLTFFQFTDVFRREAMPFATILAFYDDG